MHRHEARRGDQEDGRGAAGSQVVTQLGITQKNGVGGGGGIGHDCLLYSLMMIFLNKVKGRVFIPQQILYVRSK